MVPPLTGAHHTATAALPSLTHTNTTQSGEDGGTDFLQNFAQLVLDTLDPSLPVYVAYAHGVGFNQVGVTAHTLTLSLLHTIQDP